MKPGDLVTHRLSEIGMIGMIIKFEVDKMPVVMWDDGRISDCVAGYLSLFQAG